MNPPSTPPPTNPAALSKGPIVSWADDPWDVYGFLDYFHEKNPDVPRGNYPTKAEYEARLAKEEEMDDHPPRITPATAQVSASTKLSGESMVNIKITHKELLPPDPRAIPRYMRPTASSSLKQRSRRMAMSHSGKVTSICQ